VAIKKKKNLVPTADRTSTKDKLVPIKDKYPKVDKSKLTDIKDHNPNEKVNRNPKVQVNGKWVDKPGNGAKVGVTSAVRSGQKKELDKQFKSGKLVPIKDKNPKKEDLVPIKDKHPKKEDLAPIKDKYPQKKTATATRKRALARTGVSKKTYK
jgi:hypothetical protein